MCRKIFSAFYLILHETFCNSYGFPFMQKFNPYCPQRLLYDKHFCSILTGLSNLSCLFHQKFPLLSYDLRNDHTNNFQKCRSSCSHMFFKIGVLINLPIFTGKYLYWSHFVIQVEAWRSVTLIKKRHQDKTIYTTNNHLRHLKLQSTVSKKLKNSTVEEGNRKHNSQ